MTRVIVFIDGSNFYHTCKNHLGTSDIEFRAFCDKLAENNTIVEIGYYTAPVSQQTFPERYQTQQKFFSRIRKIPHLKLILGKLRPRNITCPRCRKIIPLCPECKRKIVSHVEKKTDVNFAVDMVALAFEDKYDTGIIVTGDGDFTSAVKLAQKLNKKIIIAHFARGYSSELNQTCDSEIILDADYMEGCYLDY
ncbi:MAG: NYN domain-containing protein [Candidatus Altiarchaeales archaeon]|nr:NYN domain-containing protein [Candidatus Altiarchaeales archaeon]MBD3417072.1 NYN domain-containing protein [Candidatus Altiarchaeales archaeon]